MINAINIINLILYTYIARQFETTALSLTHTTCYTENPTLLVSYIRANVYISPFRNHAYKWHFA